MRPDPLIGATVGRYRIVRLIGRGGMSVVYLARDEELARDVALKILGEDLSRDETLRRRFVRESRLASSLEHPNIVPVFDFGEHGETLFAAMRYVSGRDLRDRLERSALSPSETTSVLSQVASALDAAHDAGLVHRDVKPGNILLEGEGDRAYLADFGLARRTQSSSALTKSGDFMGTINYVSPEQIHGADVDRRSDVYSLGCVLYECLTGKPPFDREEDMAVMYAHLMEAPPKPTRVRPELPAPVDTVVARAMAKSREDRYARAGQLVAAFGAALDPTAEPVEPAPGPLRARTAPRAVVVRPPAPGPGGPGASRRLRVAALVLVAATIVGVAVRTIERDDAPVAARPGSAPLFTDTFGGGDGAWTTQPGVAAASGGLLFELHEPGAHRVALTRGQEALEDVTIEARIDGRRVPRRSGFGLVCRASSTETYYELVLGAEGSYAIDKAVDGVFTRLSSGPAPRLGAAPRRLRASCSGRDRVTLALFVDDRRVGSAVDRVDPLTRGTVGLTAITGAGGGLRVLFDDVAVWNE